MIDESRYEIEFLHEMLGEKDKLIAELQAKLEGKDEKHKEDLVFLVQQCLKDSIQQEILQARRDLILYLMKNCLNTDTWTTVLQHISDYEQSLKQEEDKENE